MLFELTVENIAIIDQARVEFGPGLTSITGETGAGKSLLIDSIEIALGARGDATLVRSGAAKGVVSLVVDVGGNPEVSEVCVELGIELEGGTLFIQREISAEGRSTCRIGGRQVPVGTLKQIGAMLIDLHGQHDHQSLLAEDTHLGYLDLWIGEGSAILKDQVAERFRHVEELRRRLSVMQANQSERERRLDLMRYQLAEIESVRPEAGELEVVQARIERLSHAEKLAEAVEGSIHALGDAEGSALDAAGASLKSLESASRFDPKLQETVDLLSQADCYLQDAVRALRGYAVSIERDPALLDQAIGRADALKPLRKKYGQTEIEVLEFAENLRAQLKDFDEAGTTEDEIAEQLQVATADLAARCAELSKVRSTGAQKFSQAVEKELHELAMEKAVFEVGIRPKTIESDGADEVAFGFSANPGEPLKPLAKIASGGEISRVMLALKVVLSGKAGVPTLMFDEVDAGLGGRVAAIVAKKLDELSRTYQIVVITHLPQIAGRASVQFQIEKETVSGRVATRIRRLSPEERVHEIARMLSGEAVGESALVHARELLAEAPRAQPALLN